MQARYLFYCVPLLAVGFSLHAGRGWPWWRAHTLLCAAMFVLAATVPLSGYAILSGKQHATVLFAVTRAEELFGSIGAGALAFGAAAGALAVLAAVAARTRFATVAVAALAIAAPASAALAASSYDLRYDASVRHDYLPADRSWVDHTGLRDVAMVYGRGVPKEGLEQLFWNRSVTRIVLLPDAPPLDAFGADQLRIARDGTLLVGDAPLRQPLLVDGGGAVDQLRGAKRVAASQAYALWRPDGTPRLSYYARGYYRDGWLGISGSLQVFDRRIAGRISFVVRREAGERPATLTITAPGGRRTVHLEPGESQHVTIAACGRGAWRAGFEVNTSVISAGRLLGMQSTRPVWTPDPAACQKRRSTRRFWLATTRAPPRAPRHRGAPYH